MPAGAIAIYREATAGDNLDSTSYVDVDHDTTVWEDTETFEKNVGAGVTLKETGHYLGLWNEAAGLGGTLNRAEHTGRLDYNGSALVGSKGTKYIRGLEGCDESEPHGNLIFNVATANQTLKAQIAKTGGTLTGITRTANMAGLQLLKLDDDWDYCRLRITGTSTQQLPLGVAWTYQDELDTDSFAHTVLRSPIQFKKVGWHLVTYCIRAKATSVPAARLGFVPGFKRLTPSVAFSEFGYSFGYTRQLGGSDHGTGTACFIFYNDTADSTWQVYVTKYGGGGQLELVDCAIQIAKLPDTVANACMCYDTTGGQSLDVSETPFTWGQEYYDNDAFDHDTGSSTDDIVIKKPGPFLFFGSWIANRASGINRYQTKSEFRKGGTAYQYGIPGSYNRGSTVLYSGLNHAILLPWLSVDDTIDFAREDESSSSATAPATIASYGGFSGIYLPSIFPKYNQGWFLQ